MFTRDLPTVLSNVQLVAPNVARDTPLSVAWLEGDHGRETLRLMGVLPQDNKPSTFAAERQRVSDFLEQPDQLNWMIEVDGKVGGAVWVDLTAKPELPAPSIHIMIGDMALRGRGIGSAALEAVVNYMDKARGVPAIYSRYIADNSGSAALLEKLHFTLLGPLYTDTGGLQWQNVVRTI
jgi:RimJ/RimL family protein N-acetyltransferase